MRFYSERTEEMRVDKRDPLVLLCVYLISPSVKTVGQEFELSDSSNLRGHLDYPDQLLVVQTPQVQQVGASTSSKALSIAVNVKQLNQCSAKVMKKYTKQLHSRWLGRPTV